VANTAQPRTFDEHRALGAAPAAHGRAPVLYVLSGDDALLLELGPLLGTRYRTRPIDTADQIVATTSTPWALMIDATARPDARAQAARVKQQFPQAPLLVICADGTTSDWQSPLARGALAAVVERGALSSPAFEAALDVADRQMAASAADSLDSGSPGRFGRPRTAWLVIGISVLMAASGAWYLHSQRTANSKAKAAPAQVAPPPAAPSAAQPPAVAAPAENDRTVLELLSDARVAFREGKKLLPSGETSPTGNSALELYLRVLAQDPQNEEARDGLRRLFAVASARIHADLNAGKDEDAAHLLAAFRNIGIDPAAVAALDAEIAAARPKALAMQTRSALAKGDTDSATQLLAQLAATGADRTVVTQLQNTVDSQRASARLGDLASRARALIKSGALLEPANDNAQATALAMQQINRNSPLTQSVEHELQMALIDRTLAASHAAQFELAQQLLNAAAILGNSPELTTARAQVQKEIDAPRVRAPAPTAAPTPVAEAAAAAADYLRAKPLAPLNVVYPQRALDLGQQGYVIVEFTLDSKGRASDPKIIESSPPKIFDGAAMQAIARGRFDASELGPKGESQRARIRIAFKPVPKQSGE